MVPLDSFSLVRASDEEFRDFVHRLEVAFREGAACLTVDRDTGLLMSTAFDRSAVDLSDEEWESFTHQLYHATQLIFFAAEDAPPSVIARWAKEYDEKLVDQATSRVGALKEGAPSFFRSWERRGASLLPTLGDLDYEIFTTTDGTKTVVIRLFNSEISPFARATASDKSDSGRSLAVSLEKNDVAYLQSVLREILKELGDAEDEAT